MSFACLKIATFYWSPFNSLFIKTQKPDRITFKFIYTITLPGHYSKANTPLNLLCKCTSNHFSLKISQSHDPYIHFCTRLYSYYVTRSRNRRPLGLSIVLLDRLTEIGSKIYFGLCISNASDLTKRVILTRQTFFLFLVVGFELYM